MNIFFAHPIPTYCTPAADAAIAALVAGGHTVIDPSEAALQDAWAGPAKRLEALTGADAVAFLPFADGRLGAGVIMEVNAAIRAGKGVLAFDAEGQSLGPVTAWPGNFVMMSVEDTVALTEAFKGARIQAGQPAVPQRPAG